MDLPALHLTQHVMDPPQTYFHERFDIIKEAHYE